MASIYAKGLSLSALTALLWGLDTVLLGMVSVNIPVLGRGLLSGYLVMAFLHDAFGFVCLLVLMAVKGELGHTFTLLRKTRKGKACCVAAVFGAPIGMSTYVLAIGYATPAYASAISVIYPGIGAILAYVLLKERITRWAAVGIAMSVAGAVALGFSNIDLSQYPNFSLGVVFAFVTAFCWGLEGVIIAFATRHIEEDDVEATAGQCLTIRYFTSTLCYSLLVIPIAGGYDTVAQITGPQFVGFFGIGAVGVIAYLSWYKAISVSGAAVGTALNSTLALWAMLFSWLILGKVITAYLMVCGAVIVAGVFLLAFHHGARPADDSGITRSTAM